MNLIVTEAALKELNQFSIPEGYGIRIDAELTGG